MKLSVVAGCALLFSQSVTAFQVAPVLRPTTTSLDMFSGAGAGAPKEDNPEEIAAMTQAAQSMGMSLAEYKLAMNARVKLAEKMDTTLIKAGKPETVQVERDLNNPAKTFEIKITEAGKALGKEDLSKQLVAALKKSGEDARVARGNAQKEMMQYIGDQLKQ